MAKRIFNGAEIKFTTTSSKMTNGLILLVVGCFKTSIVAFLLIAYLADLVHAQDASLSGKPCVIVEVPEGRKYNLTYQYRPYPANVQYSDSPETLKGTCYYDTNGVISYWIVRWWDDKMGKPFSDEKEFVGFAVAQKEQRRYNHEVVETLGWVDFGAPPHGRCRTNQDSDYPATYGACWDFWRLKGPDEKASDLPYLRMNVPRGIPETGELNADTLRIPLFANGGALLSALALFRDLCMDVDIDYMAWAKAHAGSDSTPENRNGGDNQISFCDPKKERPKNDKLNQYQSLLQAIGDQLNAAQAAARRFDKVITEYYTPVQPKIPPAGLANQLAWLQTSLVTHLRKAQELDRLTQTYETTIPAFFSHPPIHPLTSVHRD
jgi:hypothetical protein